ncbi:NAD(P)-dependent oxidoreductase [Mesoplasma lactucae]|uniref:NAD(P)-binding domain-containing protein n=1 Tax=Mesoplasma lactucae ATCC 49193 TaxID=81460 RepID=A0A291IRY0_9MOLU|nr:NAD(P)H-binding protein [Mesoplasma lactucae]ATG97466.1 hypothetical protein CP520_01685 [Mesoplasma lactucae ATCC 49193]ATZ20079.1 NADH-flavin reductase [Mesoplasma lactucae ATCC 49193]MCL8216827.1 hypothetical protein [Mesoplasma lactucae ATCC 49193]
MKILILGADGKLGRMLVNDAISAGYSVATMTRQPFEDATVENIVGAPEKIDELKKAVNGVDMIISALGAKDPETLLKMAKNIASVAKEHNIPLIWSGGSGTLIDNQGKTLATDPNVVWDSPMYKMLKPAVFGAKLVLEYLPTVAGLKYVYVSPPIDLMLDRTKTTYKWEISDKALYNAQGQSICGYQTLAQAEIDLIKEFNQYENHRITLVETETL